MTATSAEPRRMGRPRALTHAQIVDTALELARTEGFDGVSMRGLGAALGVRPATLYAYVSGKDELVAAMVERLFAPLAAAEPTDGDWRQQLADGIRGYFRTLVDNPSLAAKSLAVARRVPALEVLLERWLALLEEGGVTGPDAAELLAALTSFSFGTATVLAWYADADLSTSVISEAASPRATRLIRELDVDVLSRAFEVGLAKLLDL